MRRWTRLVLWSVLALGVAAPIGACGSSSSGADAGPADAVVPLPDGGAADAAPRDAVPGDAPRDAGSDATASPVRMR